MGVDPLPDAGVVLPVPQLPDHGESPSLRSKAVRAPRASMAGEKQRARASGEGRVQPPAVAPAGQE